MTNFLTGFNNYDLMYYSEVAGIESRTISDKLCNFADCPNQDGDGYREMFLLKEISLRELYNNEYSINSRKIRVQQSFRERCHC